MACLPWRSAVAVVTTLAGLAIMAGCGGSSPTTPNPPPQPPPPPTISFASDNEAATENAIVIDMTTTGTESFTLTLNATSVIDLFGYALDIVFDPTIVALVDAPFGVFLDAEGITVTSQSVENPVGTLIVGQSRVGAVPGVTGSGVLLTLNFTAVAPGSTTVVMQNTAAIDSNGADLGLEFVGGSVTVPDGGP